MASHWQLAVALAWQRVVALQRQLAVAWQLATASKWTRAVASQSRATSNWQLVMAAQGQLVAPRWQLVAASLWQLEVASHWQLEVASTWQLEVPSCWQLEVASTWQLEVPSLWQLEGSAVAWQWQLVVHVVWLKMCASQRQRRAAAFQRRAVASQLVALQDMTSVGLHPAPLQGVVSAECQRTMHRRTRRKATVLPLGQRAVQAEWPMADPRFPRGECVYDL
jgi:hypothetical protein